jgi:serine/threonine protein kinase
MKIFDKVREASPEGEQQALGRLKSEISVLRQGRPGLPELLSANEAEKWIVTEFFPNGTLEDHLDIYRGKPAVALRAFHSLVTTAASLHDEKIVHRDVKPANVFIRDHSELVLGDFGIVYLPNQPDRQTRTNERVGPSDYMPPWAHRDQRFEMVEPNFDVYMLGKLLWCMVAGRLKLFREEHHSPEFDLTVMFPNDPNMHVINGILDLCIVLKPSDCRQSARQLLPAIDEAIGILSRGGQLLSDGIPRPCRFCGKGYYRPGNPASNLDREIKLRTWRGQKPVPLAPLRMFTCDTCGHVEMFVARGH